MNLDYYFLPLFRILSRLEVRAKGEEKRIQIEHARDALYMARDIIKELNKKTT